MGDNDDVFDNPPASSPCAMHEVDAHYMGLRSDPASSPPGDLRAWRKTTRDRLIAARLAMPARERMAHDRRISSALEAFIGDIGDAVVSAYWPFRGEPDLRALLGDLHRRGGRPALPVVVAPGEPLVFRAWTPGAALERGVWDIPVPAADAAPVVPDIVIAPVVGFDPACYRLGYGGGFFDRTLAAMPRRPRFIGVGHEIARLPTIFPQIFDVVLDAVVTELAVYVAPSEAACGGAT